jgi:hypothetical protein
MTEYDADLVRMGLLMAWGFTIAIVFFHASYNDRHVLFWTIIACMPVLGILIYFLVFYVQGLGGTARRYKLRAERRWEFQLTDKGKKKDPNVLEEEAEQYKIPTLPGHRAEVIDESPPSRDFEEEQQQ